MSYKSLCISVSCYIAFSVCQAGQLGEAKVLDAFPNGNTVTYEIVNKNAVLEGDILLDKADHLHDSFAVVTLKVNGTRWPHGIVPFEISEEMPLDNKIAIYQAMDCWRKNTNVDFVELTSKNREGYKDYVTFKPAAGSECSSHVGKHGGAQAINLAKRCTTMNTVHEIGHALGLWHEQSRADRDSYIRIAWENISEHHKHNFTQRLNDGKDIGVYDYQSIMHYSQYAFSNNGEKTIIPLIQGVEIGQRQQLSPNDIAAVNAMYPEM